LTRLFRRMEIPQVPSQDAAFTRPLEPLTPSIEERRPRKTQRQHLLPPEVVPYGGTTRKTTMVANTLRQGIEATITEAKRTEEILKDFAHRFDTFTAEYTTQQDQHIAEDISEVMGQALVIYYQNKYGTQRVPHSTHAPDASKSMSYAEKARKGSTMKTQVQPSSARPKKPSTKQSSVSRADLRILVTVPSTELHQREESYVLRKRLANTIPDLSLAKVPEVTPTRTGWAIKLADIATRDALMSENNRSQLLGVFRGLKAATPENWVSYAVPNVPSSFIGVFDPRETVLVTEQLVAEEVFTQVGETPVRCAVSKNGTDPTTAKATWIVSFKKTVKPFCLFNSTCIGRLIKPKIKITHHINGCQGWCNPLKCNRLSRCNNCSMPLNAHEGPAGTLCTAPTKCANCFSPHKSGHGSCPAAPKVRSGCIVKPTKNELKNIRSAGLLATRTALKARASIQDNSLSPSSSTGSSLDAQRQTSSPSPDQPRTSRKRGGQRVTEYEQDRSFSRPARGCKPIGSMNLPELSRKSFARKSPISQQSQQPNPFAPLISKELSEEDMDLDADTEESS
jgi:hypothetical protein